MRRFFCSVLFFIAGPLYAAAPLQLLTEHFPPYNYQDGDRITGINAEIIHRLCEITNTKCSMQLYPWLRAYEYTLQNPQGGLFTTSRTPERQAKFQWVGPLASSRAFLYRLKSRPQVNPKNLQQAQQFGVAVARGDVYEEFLLQNGFIRGKNLLDFSSKSAPIALFLQGKVDLIIGSELVMPAWLAAHNSSVELVEPVLELETKGDNYLALNLAVPPAQVEALQQALDEMKRSGEYQRIVARLFVEVMPEVRSNKIKSAISN
ncbi:MAG: transporter substrate-binding domain-containing protein [Rheinheimera sp.]|nr:MAG: transporter substrate-binding domain-containing protein [Rheinheimera sp.]